MFQLTQNKYENLRSQNVISYRGRYKICIKGIYRAGVAMLSSALHNYRVIETNIFIIRVFAKMREMVLTNKDILLKLEQMERAVSKHDENIEMIFAALKELLNPPAEPRRRIGFKANEE